VLAASLMTTMAILVSTVLAFTGIAQEQSGHSAAPDAASIVSQMKQALVPAIPSVRVMTLRVNGPTSSVQWKMAQARAKVNGLNRMLTVMLLPSSWGKGIALLDEDNPSPTAAVEYIYLPAIQRVRRFTALQAWEPFFGSDFSYQDFSFPRLSTHAVLKGTEHRNGTACYRLEESLANNPYYSRIENLGCHRDRIAG